jgi:hypothetical protein
MAAMSANAVLMKFFKLPPAVRMMLALVGFGSLATILFTLLPSLRTARGRIILLIIFGVGLVLFLVFWGIRRLFFKKKSSELSEALDSQGPTRGDIAEQEQIYREKFRAKLADLKANGLSVYKLPWFVLIGEPGCGKTASLIHSGLDFPLGKDEVPGFGGTRNYNWWFSNDAVILDTAGRIAFQEEGTTDKVEWEYFLKLLKNHRPRCPVNGLVVAIPANKLLRDNAEERAQKATILRERLRQVHQALGIRFPTFVLVTKMDLVGGFSEFFEEIRVDLKQRNQMCGWSRPGEFQEPYDPNAFPEAFDQVYGRLRDWSMRYLQRKATEDELGMIVTFPESFRQLREPLHDYISTVFQKSPLLEPPFFRGFYFTSAVQEGAPIFDVFTKSKAGIRVAERPTKAVDSKAFFIHDLYTNKVFPEHGLVFRSAKHVSLNQRMRRVVWIGSAAMILLMIAIFVLGTSGVHGLIKAPRETCQTAVQAIEKAGKGEAKYDLAFNLRIAKELEKHYKAYGAPWTALYARLLFVGANIKVPQECVGKIHARFVLDCLLTPIVEQVEQRLASTEIPPITAPEARGRYLAALGVYTKWYGEVVGQENPSELDQQEAAQRTIEFERLLEFLDLGAEDRKDAATQFELALDTLSAESRSFALHILRDRVGFDTAASTETIVAAVNRITDSWKPLTQLTADNTNPWVKYWADFADRVGELRRRYAEVLDLAGGFASADQYEEMVDRFLELTRGVQYLGDPDITTAEPGSLHEAYYNLMAFLASRQVPETVEHRIIRLGELLSVFESQWNREFEPLKDALAVGAPDRGRAPQARVYEAVAQGQTDLATAFQRSLMEIRSRLGLEPDVEPLTYYVNQNLIEIAEANPPTPFEGPAKVMLARNALGLNDRLKAYLIELREMMGGQQQLEDLQDLQKWPSLLQGLGAGQPMGKLLGLWFAAVDRADVRTPSADLIRQQSGLKEFPFWRPVDLFELAKQMWKAYQASSIDLLLTRMAEAATATIHADQMPGLARLIPGFDDPSALPFDRHRFNIAQITPAVEETPAQPEEEQPEGEGLRRFRHRRPEPKPDEQVGRLEREGSTALLYEYHTREFLQKTLRAFEQVQAALEQQPGGQRVLKPLGEAANAYIDAYFGDWYDIYSDPTRLLDERTLAFLEQCRDGALSWPEFVEALGRDENNFAHALADRMEKLVHEAVMFDVGLGDDAIAEAVFDRIKDQLGELKRQRRSIPDLARSMREQRNAPPPGEPNPEVVYSGRLESAWRDYVREVRNLGPLTDESRRPSGQPPDLEKLAEAVVYKQATTTQFPLIAPLMDIAAYGQQLLVHHLDSKLAALFARHHGEYPLIHVADALDDSALLTRIRERTTMDPQAFIDLLKLAAEFQANYGELYSDVQRDSPAHRTLHLCAAWTKFLYDDPEALARGEPPRPLKLWLEICRDQSGKVGSAARVYSTLTVTLPILSESSVAAPALVRRVRAGEDIPYGSVQQVIGNKPPEYRWDPLVGKRVSFPRMTAVVSDKHPDASAAYPAQAVGWDLPGSPWSLLMAMGAQRDNDLGDGYWRIPVRMETGVDPIGFVIGLRMGSREQPFPGVIPPLDDPGPRPRMAKAVGYLTRPP